MFYITGDIHGTISIGRLNTKNFSQQKTMTKKDYVIIAGDFGLLWDGGKGDQYWLKWLDQKNFTTLFIDGNHENFNLLEDYPVEEWNGGKIRKINNSVFHLLRGQVFQVNNRKFFTFGGADSHDKIHRKENISWWKREMPSHAEYEEGMMNLDKHNWEVDYVITHTCSIGALESLRTLFDIDFSVDQMHKYFEQIKNNLTYKEWYFGHFHHDIELSERQKLIYNSILQLN